MASVRVCCDSSGSRFGGGRTTSRGESRRSDVRTTGAVSCRTTQLREARLARDEPEPRARVGFDQRSRSSRSTTRSRSQAVEVTGDSLQLFLKDIGKVDLLTAAQEVELAKRIERGDHRAKQEMVEANLRLVVSIAKRYRNQGLPVPRPDPGGDDRARPRRREVRLPQGLQVLDVRDVVDPPGRRARARRQGPDDPDARARRREAEQDPPRRAEAARRARPRADVGGDRGRARPDASRRSSRSGAPRRRRSRSRSPWATTRIGVRSLHRGRLGAAPGRRRRT